MSFWECLTVMERLNLNVSTPGTESEEGRKPRTSIIPSQLPDSGCNIHSLCWPYY